MTSRLQLCHRLLALTLGLGFVGVAGAASAPCAAPDNSAAITNCFLDLTQSGSGDVSSPLPRVRAPSADGSTVNVGGSEFLLNGNGTAARTPRAPLATHSGGQSGAAGGVAHELQALLPGSNFRCAQPPCKVRAPLSVGRIDGGDGSTTPGQQAPTPLPTPPSALLLALGLLGLVTTRLATGAKRASRVQ
jgi:hypothetical protein